ncbi:MAG: AraC family transcriptional regulator [Polyangiaceae bacterium]
MARPSVDVRAWCNTDCPGERISLARPLPGVQVLSVQGSHRRWSEAHEWFTVASVHTGQDLVANWRTRCRSLSTEGGGIMAMEPGDVHVTERLQARRGAADFDVLQFAPQLVLASSQRLGFGTAFHFRAPALRDSQVSQHFERFVEALANDSDALSLECALSEALTALITRLGEAPTRALRLLDPERDYRLRRVREYLASHLERRPTLKELEAVSGLCQFRLCALFKKNYGRSPGQCWNALRLRAALRRLESGSNVKTVVAELGYSNESYFWRVFKAHYGVAPGAWLAMYRQNDRALRARLRLR